MAQELNTPERLVDGLERQRQKLQENVDKLHKSIKIWQTWEAEYEGLREELQRLEDSASSQVIDEVGSQCVGEFLNQKEINLLIRNERKQPRTCQQVIGLLSRRIEYVQSNVKSLEGSLQTAEGKLMASQALSPAQQNDEEGYPLIEIQEELDEDGNVISSSVTPASQAAPQVLEALRNAGVPGLQHETGEKATEQVLLPESKDTKTSTHEEVVPSALKQVKHSPPNVRQYPQRSPSTSESEDSRGSGRRRKSVTFADGTKQAPPTPAQPRLARDVQAAKAASAARRVKAEVRGSIDALKKVHNAGFITEEVFDRFRKEYVDRLHNLPAALSKPSGVQSQAQPNQQPGLTEKASSKEDSDPALPQDESAEDAALRREMIKYNMDEVGAIVAELNLDEDDQSYSSNPEYSNEDSGNRNSSDEDENDWGISTSRTLSDDYIQEMQALDQRLNARSQQTASPDTFVEALLRAEDELVVGGDGNPVKKTLAEATARQEKKAVRFARELDIEARPPSSKIDQSRDQFKSKRASASVHADIVERRNQTNSSPNPTGPTPKKKTSQFKMSRSAEHPAAPTAKKEGHLQIKASDGNQVKTPSLPAFTPPATPKITPTGPPGRTHAPHVVERAFEDNVRLEDVCEPNELDTPLLQQELAMDYHRTRNRMMQRQGGYLANDEDEEQSPLVDENGKKISRFKAARLRGLEG